MQEKRGAYRRRLSKGHGVYETPPTQFEDAFEYLKRTIGKTQLEIAIASELSERHIIELKQGKRAKSETRYYRISKLCKGIIELSPKIDRHLIKMLVQAAPLSEWDKASLWTELETYHSPKALLAHECYGMILGLHQLTIGKIPDYLNMEKLAAMTNDDDSLMPCPSKPEKINTQHARAIFMTYITQEEENIRTAIAYFKEIKDTNTHRQIALVMKDYYKYFADLIGCHYVYGHIVKGYDTQDTPSLKMALANPKFLLGLYQGEYETRFTGYSMLYFDPDIMFFSKDITEAINKALIQIIQGVFTFPEIKLPK